MSTPAIRLRTASDGILALPWSTTLASWPESGIAFRDLPVAASRHVVRFVDVGGVTFALKELPIPAARSEYEILRELESRDFPSVRAVGLVERAGDGAAVLVTNYLEHSFQFRRLFQRLPPGARKPRERLLDAIATLLVDLHRAGVFWGDCSLANTLFRRDGQMLQAFLVDAETSELHPSLTDGQRAFDLEILVENVAGDLADVAAQVGRSPELLEEDLADAESVILRYCQLWDELHREETIGPDDRYLIEARVRRLNDLGFSVDELSLDPDGDRLRLKVGVTSRRFHAQELRRRTGLDVGEGQATILLNDLRAYGGLVEARFERSVSREEAADRWLHEVFQPTVDQLLRGPLPPADVVQGYCDLIEVRWLLSEQAGHNVGDDVALAALLDRQAPPDSAAGMAVAESPTGVFDVSAWTNGDAVDRMLS
jgi:hypothetical protein